MAQPRRVAPPESAEQAQPDPSPDQGRVAIEKALAAAAPVQREQTPAEKVAAFGNEVRSRVASTTAKDGTPSPRRTASDARMELAQAAFRVWDYRVEYGTPFEDLLDKAYWGHVARKLSTWDQIVVRADDGSYYAELIVTEKGQLYACVVPKPGYPLPLQVSEPDVDASIPSGYSVKWLGEYNKYGVIRHHPNGDQCIKSGIASKAAAATWIQNLMRAQR